MGPVSTRARAPTALRLRTTLPGEPPSPDPSPPPPLLLRTCWTVQTCAPGPAMRCALRAAAVLAPPPLLHLNSTLVVYCGQPSAPPSRALHGDRSHPLSLRICSFNVLAEIYATQVRVVLCVYLPCVFRGVQCLAT